MVIEASFQMLYYWQKNQHCYKTKRTYKTSCAKDMYAEHLFCIHLKSKVKRLDFLEKRK